MHEQNITHSQTKLGDIAHEQTIIYRQLFAGLSANKEEEKFATIDNTVCHVYAEGWKMQVN